MSLPPPPLPATLHYAPPETIDRVDGIVSLDPAHAVRFFWMGLASCGNVVGSMLALRWARYLSISPVLLFTYFLRFCLVVVVYLTSFLEGKFIHLSADAAAPRFVLPPCS